MGIGFSTFTKDLKMKDLQGFFLTAAAAGVGFVLAASLGSTIASRVGRISDAIGFDDVFGG